LLFISIYDVALLELDFSGLDQNGLYLIAFCSTLFLDVGDAGFDTLIPYA
jgi:hypothetical protein